MPEKNYSKLTTHITVRKYSYLFCVNKNIHIYYRHRHTRDGFRNLITGFLLHQNIIVYHKMYPCVFQICEIDIWGINQRLKSKTYRFVRYKVNYMSVCMGTIYEFDDHSPTYDSWLWNDKPNYKISMPKRKQRVGFFVASNVLTSNITSDMKQLLFNW